MITFDAYGPQLGLILRHRADGDEPARVRAHGRRPSKPSYPHRTRQGEPVPPDAVSLPKLSKSTFLRPASEKMITTFARTTAESESNSEPSHGLLWSDPSRRLPEGDLFWAFICVERISLERSPGDNSLKLRLSCLHFAHFVSTCFEKPNSVQEMKKLAPCCRP